MTPAAARFLSWVSELPGVDHYVELDRPFGRIVFLGDPALVDCVAGNLDRLDPVDHIAVHRELLRRAIESPELDV